MKRLPPLLLTTLLLTCPPTSRAQAPVQPPPAESVEARERLERGALRLLEEALAEAQGLKLTENRARAQVTAARLLWPRDQKAARAAFKAAADGLAELGAGVDPEDPNFYNASQAVTQLRGEMLQVAGQFDAKLALDFLRASRPAYGEAFTPSGFGHPTQEQILELNLAGQIAAQEPQRVLEIAEENLNKGMTFGLLNVLNQLRAKDPAAASKLATAMVRKLRPEEMRNHYEASMLAQQLLLMTRPPEQAQPAPPGVSRPTIVALGAHAPAAGGAALLDEQARRELVEKLLTAVSGGVVQQGGSYYLAQALQALLPELERAAPARAAALRRRSEELERASNPHQHYMRPYQELINSGTAEALAEAAQKAPAEARDQLYVQAAWKVFREGGDAERARQILDQISNPQQRAQARRNLEQLAQSRAAERGNFQEARQMASRLRGVEDRVGALLMLASRASSAGEAQTARQALEEARGLVETQTRGHQQFSGRLQVATGYARLDPAVSFEIVEAAVARLDDLLDAAAVLDGFGQEAFREGELRAQGGYMWSEMINQCAQALALLAPSDFERAAAVAKKFRRTEARVAAQLGLARQVLESLPDARRNRGGGFPHGPPLVINEGSVFRRR